MKTLFALLLTVTLAVTTSAQLITRFTFDNSSIPGTALNGINALSISSFALISTGGVNGTNGLNAGLGNHDINMVLDGTQFNVSAIDISIDFRKEESQASFFNRGSYFDFGMNSNKLGVTFKLNGVSGPVTVTSGNILTIPDDHLFHTYRFNYDDNAGKALVYVDGTVVYTYTGVANSALYYTGAGNVTIGMNMDGTGRNVAVLDNLVVQKYANALLPLTLLNFNAEKNGNVAKLSWSTTKEVNVASYSIEKSTTGNNFNACGTLIASNSYASTNNYSYTDTLSAAPVNYYRLKMTNKDGSFTYSSIRSVNANPLTVGSMKVYPNPVCDYLTISISETRAALYHYTVFAANGQAISKGDKYLNAGSSQINIDLTRTGAKGVVLVQVTNSMLGSSTTFTVIRK